MERPLFEFKESQKKGRKEVCVRMKAVCEVYVTGVEAIHTVFVHSIKKSWRSHVSRSRPWMLPSIRCVNILPYS